MIKINSLSIPLKHNENTVKTAAAKAIGQSVDSITKIIILKKSIDARKKNNIHYVMTVAAEVKNENAILKKCKNIEKYIYYSPLSVPKSRLSTRPVVVGFGPAGIFAALILAEAGARPIVLERGEDVDSRKKKTDLFWQSGILDEECNVQFGEGGAGAFSDGKLNTGTHSPLIRQVLKELTDCGAPCEILYQAKPHIGTDKLLVTVKNIREKIKALGGEVLFGAKLCDFESKSGKLVSCTYVKKGEKYAVETNNLILATGHSARDIFLALLNKGIEVEQKAFSVGMRIEHLQSELNRSMYGENAPIELLPPADYRLAVHLENGRGVYTFCMCPGGMVVAAASEEGRLAVNGMSYQARDGHNANSAMIVTVRPEDFGGGGVLSGVSFQRRLEEAAFRAGGGCIPVQLLSDFCQGVNSRILGEVEPCMKGAWSFGDVRGIFPEHLAEALKEGILGCGKILPGFDRGDAVLSGVESRTSSPVRILRNAELESSIGGLYPCGEGAGYAGGITSAAMDGVRAAEALAGKYRPC